MNNRNRLRTKKSSVLITHRKQRIWYYRSSRVKTEKIMKIASQTVTEKTIEQKMQQLLKQNNSMHSVAKPKIV